MSYIAERRQEEKDRRRIEIVEAAEDLYRELGWDAVTMDSVARRARLSRALVYVYFKDKQDLHFAIAAARPGACCGNASRKRPNAPAPGMDKVEACGRAYMAYAPGIPAFLRCLRAARDACARRPRIPARR